ncbi:MAG: MBL fold metallo-hydrolase [Clostridia bacterium]|nr:MBL fold metallo-hydrolase [Clostridia bacterium]
MSLTLATIASGSSGNANLIISENALIMSDCGISGKKVFSGLEALGLKSPDALLITHSHSDHTKGANIICKKYNIPVYMTKETYSECSFIPEEFVRFILPDEEFTISGIRIHPFSVSHDTKNPVAYTFSTTDDKASVVTDTGIFTSEMFSHIKGSKSIIIESNHDEKMLLEGPYPYFLKRRIAGDKGHMSNRLCASVASALLKNGTKNFMLSHISEHNNTEALAFSESDKTLSETGLPYTLRIAKKDVPTVL